MADASRDGNFVTTLLAVSSVDGVTPVTLYANPTTHRLLVDLAGGGSGTVTTVSVATANGFAGTVATATTTPAITISTSITGILKGNGTAISAVTIGSGLTYDGTTLSATGGGSGDVVGPASATDNAVARFDTTTGKLIQNSSGVLLSDTWRMTWNGADGSAFADIRVATSTIQGLRVEGDTTSAISFSTFITADAFLRFSFLASGQMTWGSGAGAGDTNLYRSAASTLRTDDLMVASLGFQPATNDGAALGAATTSFSDLFLASGGVINFNNGNMTLTHAAGSLTFAGGNVFGLGATTATTFNGLAITANGTNTLNIAAGKTLTVSNSITLAGTDSTVMTFPTTSKTIAANDGSNWTIASQAIGDLLTATSATAYGRVAAVAVGSVLASAGTGTAPTWSSAPQLTTIELGNATDTTLSRSAAGVLAVEGVVIPSISSTNTLTNKRVTPRTGTVASSATPTINTDNVDFFSITALAVDITSMTTNLSGTPTDGQKLWIAITGTAARAITWGASFEASTVALPTTTVTTNRLDVGFVWNTATSKWRCIAAA